MTQTMQSSSTSVTSDGQQVTPAQSKIMQFNSQPKSKPQSQAQVDEKEQSKETPSTPAAPPIVPAGTEPVNDIVDETEEPDENEGESELGKINDSLQKFFSDRKAAGGLGIAVGLLLLAIWLLIPTASGYTRAQLLWFSILGETGLVTRGQASGSAQTQQIPIQQNPQVPLQQNNQIPLHQVQAQPINL